jgi:hypothetical protein
MLSAPKVATNEAILPRQQITNYFFNYRKDNLIGAAKNLILKLSSEKDFSNENLLAFLILRLEGIAILEGRNGQVEIKLTSKLNVLRDEKTDYSTKLKNLSQAFAFLNQNSQVMGFAPASKAFIKEVQPMLQFLISLQSVTG